MNRYERARRWAQFKAGDTPLEANAAAVLLELLAERDAFLQGIPDADGIKGAFPPGFGK